LIRDFIDKKPVVMNWADSLLAVSREMLKRNRNHSIIVDDSGRAWGVVSIRDIAKAIFVEGEEGIEILESGRLGKILESPIKYYASSPIISLNIESSLDDVIDLLVNKNIGFVPVIENNEIMGAIDERNLLKAIPEHIDLSPCEVPAPEPQSVDFDEEILVAVGLMLSTGVKQLLVMKGEEIYGMTSLLKILYYVLSEHSVDLLLKGSRKPVEEMVAYVSENPWQIDCTYSLKEAASLIYFERLGAVLVRINGSVKIISDRDLLKVLLFNY
jgi:predicted transcriptional regulator